MSASVYCGFSIRPLLSGALFVVFLLSLSGGGAALFAREYSRGALAEGTRWENPYYVIDSGVEGPVVLITGGMHGNELAQR